MQYTCICVKTVNEYCAHFFVPILGTSGAVLHWRTAGICFLGRFNYIVTTPTSRQKESEKGD